MRPRQPWTWAHPVMPPGIGVPQVVVGDRLPELLDEDRALRPRPDQAHVAAQDVEELGQLVDIRVAEPIADPSASGVVIEGPDRARLPLGIAPHAAELDDGEEPSPLPDPLLLVEDRPARGDQDRQGDDREQRCQQRSGASRATEMSRSRLPIRPQRELTTIDRARASRAAVRVLDDQGIGRAESPGNRGRGRPESTETQWTATSELMSWVDPGRKVRSIPSPETATMMWVARARSTSSSSRSMRAQDRHGIGLGMESPGGGSGAA